MSEEKEIECPFCGEMITIVVDTSVNQQSYIEDCSVCCRPIQIGIICDDDQIVSVSIDRS
ncbi:MAG: CPXCG motif-containing cysteine-rich protein [Bacteriovoracia bacterium]